MPNTCTKNNWCKHVAKSIYRILWRKCEKKKTLIANLSAE